VRVPEPKDRGRKILLDKKTVTLRTVAERVGLAPCSVSAVLNNTPASWAIPQRTKDRIFRAAAQLNYRPNLSARSLRTKRTHMVAVLSADFGHAPVARVVASLERSLHRRGYLLILAAFDGTSEWTRTSVELQQRGIEGVISVGASLPREVELPAVSVDLEYLTGREPLADDVCAWLTELGGSAVQAVLGMIETKSAPRKTTITIVPKFPAAYVDLSSFNLPGAGLGLHAEVRGAS
jgi:Bacterial regulatory proteins, lacI family